MTAATSNDSTRSTAAKPLGEPLFATYVVFAQEQMEVVVGYAEDGTVSPDPMTEKLLVWHERGVIKVPHRTKLKTVRDKAAEMLPDGGVFRVLDAEAARAFRAEPVVTRQMTVGEVTE